MVNICRGHFKRQCQRKLLVLLGSHTSGRLLDLHEMRTKNDRQLGKRIQILRKQKGLTQAQLAEKIGVTDKYISYIETATFIPSLKRLYQIAKALKIKVSSLFPF